MALSTLDWPIYDADQHYYEAADSFTRHLPAEFGYAFRWITDKATGRTGLIVGDKVFTMISNPTFDPVGRPGALAAYFRGENSSGTDFKTMMGKLEPCRPEYRNRERRVEVLQAQGVGGCFMLPTLALGIEALLTDDPYAVDAVLRAFNLWIDDEWGYARGDQIVAPPVLSLMDVALAEKELQRVIDRGTKAIILRPGPVVGPYGHRSPGDKMYDRFYAMCAEAGVAIAFHAADSGYNQRMDFWGESGKGLAGGNVDSPLADILQTYVEQPIFETLAAIIAHGVLDRHPRLRLVTIELGSGWVPDLLRRFKKSYGKMPHLFGADPVERFHESVWVAPFQEDSITGLVDVMNVDRILFGSDWPHPEGNENPADAIADLADLTAAQQRRIMSDNLKELLAL